MLSTVFGIVMPVIAETRKINKYLLLQLIYQIDVKYV